MNANNKISPSNEIKPVVSMIGMNNIATNGKISDRIAVMHKGHVMGILPASKAKIEEIGLMMAGEKVIMDKT